MKTSAPTFAIGDTIYHKTNREITGIVTGVLQRPSGLQYGVTWSEDLAEKWHYEIELTIEKDYANS